ARGRDLPRRAVPRAGARRTGAGRTGEVLDRRPRGAVRLGQGAPGRAGGRGRTARHPRRLLAAGGSAASDRGTPAARPAARAVTVPGAGGGQKECAITAPSAVLFPCASGRGEAQVRRAT